MGNEPEVDLLIMISKMKRYNWGGFNFCQQPGDDLE